MTSCNQELQSVFLGGLSPSTTEEELAEWLVKAVPSFTQLRLVRDSENSKGRGYAFFKVQKKVVDKIVNTSKQFLDREVYFRPAKETLEGDTEMRAFFKLKDKSMSEIPSFLKKAIEEEFGSLAQYHVYTNHKGEQKGYGFCDFNSLRVRNHAVEKKVFHLKDGRTLSSSTTVVFYNNKYVIKKALLSERKQRKKTLKRQQLKETEGKESSEEGGISLNTLKNKEHESQPKVSIDIKKSVKSSEFIKKNNITDIHSFTSSRLANIVQFSSRTPAGSYRNNLPCVVQTSRLVSPWLAITHHSHSALFAQGRCYWGF